MTMSPKSIVCFDIDDTLITGTPSVFPDSAQKAIRKLQANGHLAIINTGRVYYTTPSIIKDFGFDGMICGCGSSIYLQGKKISHTTIPHVLCEIVVNQLRSCHIAAFFECDNQLLLDEASSAQLPMKNEFKTTFHARDLSALTEQEKSSYTFDKFCVVLDETSDYEAFRHFCDPYFTYIDRGIQNGNRIGEIIQKDFSKATGISFLMERFHIPIEHCYAIGDSTNDLSMLEFVPHSIAMGKASPEILPFCEYQTSDILDHGIANALQHYHLIQI